jgi:hypothetical protein
MIRKRDAALVYLLDCVLIVAALNGLCYPAVLLSCCNTDPPDRNLHCHARSGQRVPSPEICAIPMRYDGKQEIGRVI